MEQRAAHQQQAAKRPRGRRSGRRRGQKDRIIRQLEEAKAEALTADINDAAEARQHNWQGRDENKAVVPCDRDKTAKLTTKIANAEHNRAKARAKARPGEPEKRSTTKADRQMRTGADGSSLTKTRRVPSKGPREINRQVARSDRYTEPRIYFSTEGTDN